MREWIICPEHGEFLAQSKEESREVTRDHLPCAKKIIRTRLADT